MATTWKADVVLQTLFLSMGSVMMVLLMITVPSNALPRAYANSKDFDDQIALSFLLAGLPRDQQPRSEAPISSFNYGAENVANQNRMMRTREAQRLGIHKVQTRRVQDYDSVLPPWQEFCRMLNMAQCGRFKRSSTKW